MCFASRLLKRSSTVAVVLQVFLGFDEEWVGDYRAIYNDLGMDFENFHDGGTVKGAGVVLADCGDGVFLYEQADTAFVFHEPVAAGDVFDFRNHFSDDTSAAKIAGECVFVEEGELVEHALGVKAPVFEVDLIGA